VARVEAVAAGQEVEAGEGPAVVQEDQGQPVVGGKMKIRVSSEQ
jgi:hypothetical protein